MHRVLLLVPSASYRAPDFLEAARSLGVEVIVGCDEPPVLGDNRTAVHVRLEEPLAAAEAIVALDAATPLDAVVAVDDQGTLAAAHGALRLGLPANPPHAVAAARDKALMRTRLDAAEVLQPAFACVPASADQSDLAALADLVEYPVVVKPTSLSGSQGVIRADTVAEFLAAVERSRSIAAQAGSKHGSPLLVEKFVSGPEVAVEGMLKGGELSILAVFDKPDALDGPYFEETIYVTPSRLGAGELAGVAAATQAATRALGLVEGPVHAELRVQAGHAFVIEVAARSIGGLCSRTLRFGTGLSLEYLILANALGKNLRPEKMADAAGVLMLPISSGGVLVEVSGQEETLCIPGIVALELTIVPGRTLVPLPEGNRYLGFVFAHADTPREVEAALREALKTLRVRVGPARPITARSAGL